MQGLRKTFWLLIALLLTACGGGGGGGGGSSSNVVNEAPPFPTPVPRPDPIPSGDLSISGKISVSAALAVDMDTRDPRSPGGGLTSNNAPFDPSQGGLPGPVTPTFNQYSAQLIPSPGIVGGFLYVDTYVNGVPRDGDLHDFYRVSLAAGQVVSLQISDYKNTNPFANDFDLLLLELDGTLIDFAAGLGPIETLRAPNESGEYLLLVTVCANPVFKNPPRICGDGRSNYTVTVGQPQAGSNNYGLNLSSDFALNEALVVYKKGLEENPEQQFNATASAVRVDDSRVGDVHRVSFAADVLVAQSSAVGPEEELQSEEQQAGFFVTVSPEQQEKLATLAAIKSLHRDENVSWAEPNYLREAQFIPNDEHYPLQWHYPQINLPAAWDLATGSNVTIAVLDTGILPYHPDIDGQLDPFNNVIGVDGNLHGGYDFVSSTYYSLDGDSADNDPTDPGDGNFRSSFHGTHVAGTIAAATDGALVGEGVGVVGVAFNSRIQPIRVLGRGVGTSFDISRGLCFAAGLTTDSCEGVPENPNPADIINLSLGGTGSSLTEQQLFDEITSTGILVVAAVGNSSSSRPFYPASYDGIFGVSAVDIDSNLAPYSNYGASVDLAAPGGDSSKDKNHDGYIDGVLSAGANDSSGSIQYNYPFYQGTSMAAPHVAGVFALMRSVNASLDAAAVEQLLRDGALTTRLGGQTVGQKHEDFGYGMIDAEKAVATAVSLGGAAPTPVPWLAAVPNNINFGATLDTVQFELRNNSGGTLNVESIVSSDPSWLIAPEVKANGNGNGLGLYDLDIERDDPSVQAEGVYQGALTVSADSNDVIINVIMQVNALLEFGDVGHLYVRLIDTDTGNIREVEADVLDGEYHWAINDLPPGDYKLVAFSDADYDGQVCDIGEACGAYPTIDQPGVIDLQTDMTALDYSLNYLNTGVEFGPVPAAQK
jgi:serine protease